MHKNNHSNDKVIQELVDLFETNLKEDSLTFLSEEDFECLIDYYDQLANTEKAILATEHAQNAFPYSGTFFIRMAQIQVQAKRLDLAQEAIQKAKTFEPSSPELMLAEADFLVAELKYDEAIHKLKDLLNYVGKAERSDVYLEVADVYELKLDKKGMAFWLKKCLSLDPSNEEALNRYWNYVDDEKAYEEAVVFHQKILDKAPYNFLAWNNLGNAYEELSLFEEAINAYEYAIAINENYYYVYWDLASCYEKMGDWKKAKDIFIDIAEQFEQEPQVLIEIGKCEERLGQYEAARAKFKKAIDGLTGNVSIGNAFYLVAKTYEREQDFIQAIFYYKQALEYQSDRLKYWKSLGKVQFELEYYLDAAGSFIKGIELNEKKYKLWLYLAQCYQAIGKKDMVLNVFERGIATIPNNIDLQYARAVFNLTNENTQVGLEQLEEVLHKAPNLKSSIFTLFPELEKSHEVLAVLQNF